MIGDLSFNESIAAAGQGPERFRTHCVMNTVSMRYASFQLSANYNG